jgi:replicative DNA helicase
MDDHTFASSVDRAIADAEAVSADVEKGRFRLPCTGFQELDRLTGGLLPGQLFVVASRPSVGRTTFLSSACRFNAVHGGVATSLFTLEESRDEVASRILSAQARVGFHMLKHGKLVDDDRQRIAKVQGKIKSAPLRVHADPSMTLAEIAAKAKRDVEEHDAKLIVVDGLNDIKPERPSDLREREVGDSVRGLKALARDLNVPVLVSAHLNRSAEQRYEKRPMLDDLRESGAVTFAADVIVLMYRPDLYDGESPRAGETDLILAKNRFGVLATIVAAHQFHYARLLDMAPWQAS